MTVTGATTASLAATGVYKPPMQYTQAQVPVIVTVTSAAVATGTAATTGAVDPSVVATGSGTADYASAYLSAHMMSTPSYRYAVIFWMVLAGIAVTYAVAHHLRIAGGSIGAGFNKWGMRRVTIGSKKGSRSTALPSNSVLLVSLLVTGLAIALCFVGTDYIAPGLGLFSAAKRGMATNTGPSYSIGKSMWSTASRFGIMSFALFPLVVLLALKAPPFAIFSVKVFTHLYSDKLMTFHRVTGWIIWAMTTAHVALWTVQLFRDQYNGKAVWFTLFTSVRFVCGIVAYFFLCLLMVLSVRPIRQNRYEFFYFSHVTIVLITMVASVLHHPVLWYWIAAAAALWGADRVWRMLRYARINSGGSRTARGGKSYEGLATDDIVLEEFNDKMLGIDDNRGFQQQQQRKASNPNAGYGDAEIQPAGTPRRNDMSRESMTSFGTTPNVPLIAPPPVVPAGFAQAQLLPSRMVRLTVRVKRPISWAPGQSVLLTLPELSRFQSHPFTVCGNDPEEMVLIIKARKGLTRQLYDLVRERSEASMQAATKQGGMVTKAAPVFVRAKIDGPMGSAGRVRWRDYSSILIICGGTGVSFGIAVCDFLTQMMARGEFKNKTRRIRFVWVAREYAELAWCASALCRARKLVGNTALKIDIYVSNVAPPPQEYNQNSLEPPRPATWIARRLETREDPYRGYHDDFDVEMEYAGAGAADLTNFADEDNVKDDAEDELSRHLQKQGKMRRARSRKVAKRAAMSDVDSATSPPPRPQSTLSPPMPYAPLAGADSRPGSRPISRPPSGYFNKDGQPMPASGDRLAPNGRGHSRVTSMAASSIAPSVRTVDTNPFSVYDEEHQAMLGPDANADYRSSHLLAPDADYRDRRASHRSVASSVYDRYDPYNGGDGLGLGRPVSFAPSYMNGASPTGSAGPSRSPSMVFGDDAESMRNAMSVRSRTQSMILLEDTGSRAEAGKSMYDAGPGAGTANGGLQAGSLWIDEADYAATSVLSEMARGGRPKLGAIFEEELRAAEGSMMVAVCGPTKLNTVVRNLVSRHIHPGTILRGDSRGHVAIYTEDYES
ncbi:uncharacterized protein EHS24_008405 [Apiotrichum porosum]|uniref:ferric-chelate reductase (NADPH) n=1 Tax=Apiotrichum porosum TaxID=105984 RepID=A0A427XQ43_9TREE|nr:uncharacterized protein EHS24_008405 [Apiotrichum porosum]RSH80974.1 hypothetical protein EHS24_008405 [Apiotrichum porosum]